MAEPNESLRDRIPGLTPALRRFVATQISDRDAAEDIVQDTLATGLAKLAALRDPKKLRSWLFSIARNHVLHYYRGRKLQSWAELADHAELATGESALLISERFDQSVRQFAHPDFSVIQILTLALRHSLGYTAAWIAALMHDHPSTVYRRLQRCRSRLQTLRRDPPAISPERDLALKHQMAILLFNLGEAPLSGHEGRDFELMREAMGILRLARRQYPDNPRLTIALLRMHCHCMARLPSRGKPYRIPEEFDHYRKEWDAGLLREARALNREIDRDALDSRLRHEADVAHELYLRPGGPDCARLLRLAESQIAEAPVSMPYILKALALHRLQGPLPAARFLESVRANWLLRDNPAFYRQLGCIYYLAGYWHLAHAALRRAARYPTHASRAEAIQQWIRECKAKMPRKPR